MTTLHDLIRESASTQERELAGIGRPSLHGRARRARVVRHARIATGATVGAGALVVGAALVVPAMWPHDTTAIGTLAPAGSAGLPLAADGSLMTVIPANNVVVDIYLDPMCPICREFSSRYDADLRAIDGATVVYHPVSILDRASSDGSYSTRAASAIQEVAAGAPDRLGAFLDLLWANQPLEGSGTLTDAELTQLALDAGVPADVSALFAQHRYADAVAQATQAAAEAGVQGTPTVFIDGTMFGGDYDTLMQQIQQAIVARTPGDDLSKLSGNPTPSPQNADAGAAGTEVSQGPADLAPATDAPATVRATAPASIDPSVSQAP